MAFVTIYSTWPDADAAKACARALLEARLIACANILAGATSLFWWDGAVTETTETILLAKTTQNCAPGARDLIASRHPYSTPCVIAWPILPDASHASFLHWIGEETDSSESGS
jgi:periplasmic divalent cation tolerance protein